MSDPYTPDTEEVRGCLAELPWYGLTEEEFDRWLAKVQAEAWDEGYNAGELCGLTAEQADHACPINPHRDGADQ